jgi:tetratricopeptide (TPR) repeat protein
MHRPAAALLEALRRSTSGDVEGALTLLDESQAAGDLDAEGLGLRFLLLQKVGREQDAMDTAGAALEVVDKPLQRSTWLLRRGMLALDLEEPLAALRDFQEVMRLDVSEDHTLQARAALLRLAQAGSIH